MFFKRANTGLFMFIFVLFNKKFNRKTADYRGIQTRIVAVKGKHADHLTTTSAPNDVIKPTKLISKLMPRNRKVGKLVFIIIWSGMTEIISKGAIDITNGDIWGKSKMRMRVNDTLEGYSTFPEPRMFEVLASMKVGFLVVARHLMRQWQQLGLWRP